MWPEEVGHTIISFWEMKRRPIGMEITCLRHSGARSGCLTPGRSLWGRWESLEKCKRYGASQALVLCCMVSYSRDSEAHFALPHSLCPCDYPPNLHIFQVRCTYFRKLMCITASFGNKNQQLFFKTTLNSNYNPFALNVHLCLHFPFLLSLKPLFCLSST